MQRIHQIFWVSGLSLLFCACQRVIPVSLNPGATKYVIEGIVTDQPGGASVSITQTKNFSSNNSFAGVSGAAVTIENGGASYTLAESSPGIYSCPVLTGVPGNT